ncbi:MAG: MCP four helix bundle domain-containing protein [Melioribacteraceae bacterium]|nr:MCP four helix bundle domain-containing protein [Melioribacteraceae bacterium]
MFKNLKIGKKLSVGFGIAVAAQLIIILLSIGILYSLNSKVDLLANEKFVKTVFANNIVDAVNESLKATQSILMVDDFSTLNVEEERISKANQEIRDNITKLKNNITSEEEGNLLAEIEQIKLNEYDPIHKQVISLYKGGDRISAIQLTQNQLSKIEAKYIESVFELVKYQTDFTQEVASDAASTFQAGIIILVIIGITMVITVILIASTITKSIKNPLILVKERMAQLESVCLANLGNGLISMSNGDLTAKVTKGTEPLKLDLKDEIGEMANVFDSMLYKAQGGIDEYEKVRVKIRELSEETNELISEAKEGNLNSRGNVNKFKGSYKEIVEGINNLLDTVIIPIQDGLDVLEKIAVGDLTARLTKDYKGVIKERVNSLGDSLERIIIEISEAVAATASASTQISSSAEEMAAGAQEQSAQASEVASAVEQMTSTILQTTKHASTAAESSKRAGSLAKEGGEVVAQTVVGMNRIAEVVRNAAQTVQELGASSDQIGEIVQVIDDIADQTNLLALNAAIEAARAGEQGRGFAVVADEVRKLAERTTKATKEIGEMIKKIQGDTGGAVKSISLGTEEVEKGKQLADKAGKSLQEIIKGSNDVVDVVNQVAAASEEQSSASEQISRNIEAISSVTQQSAAGTQQIARAAEDLNRLTEGLQKLVGAFKIRNENKKLILA